MLTREQAQVVVDQYAGISATTRSHMLRRLMWCQYDEIAEELPEKGIIFDLGCGFGHFGVYLSLYRPNLSVYGCDPDTRKIAVANKAFYNSQTPGRSTFWAGTYQEWKNIPDQGHGIVILDVLYLMPLDAQKAMLSWSVKKLSLGGKLVIKTIDPSLGLKSKMAELQEWFMVRLLRKTFSSGTWAAGQAPSWYMTQLEALGMTMEYHALPQNRTPAVLLVGTKMA